MDNYILPSTAVVTALAVSILLFRRTSADEPGKKLSPGPAPNFLVGHTLQVPTTRPWVYFENLGEIVWYDLWTHGSRQMLIDSF